MIFFHTYDEICKYFLNEIHPFILAFSVCVSVTGNSIWTILETMLYVCHLYKTEMRKIRGWTPKRKSLIAVCLETGSSWKAKKKILSSDSCSLEKKMHCSCFWEDGVSANLWGLHIKSSLILINSSLIHAVMFGSSPKTDVAQRTEQPLFFMFVHEQRVWFHRSQRGKCVTCVSQRRPACASGQNLWVSTEVTFK